MVLQRDADVPVWGTAAPGEKVSVGFAGQDKTAVADADGRWRVDLDPLAASADGRTLEVRGSETAAALELEDVLVGEVWLASGQSNMDFSVSQKVKYFAGVANEAEEIAAANYPLIRVFTGAADKAYAPQAAVGGEWQVCSPATVPAFSAVAYFFARDLQRQLPVPVGIVTLAYGASTAQAWIRREAIAADPRLRPALSAFDAAIRAYVPPTAAELKQWQDAAARARAAGQRPPRRPRSDPAQDQHNPTVLYNGMVDPVVPFAIRGVIWYQGESITGSHALFPVWNQTLIDDWRNLWGRRLPFYFCQLAGQDAGSNSPEVRELQAEALALPDTGMAVTVDIGERHNVHPKDKQDVGDRLSRIALALAYGRDIEYSGPWYRSMSVEGSSIRVRFSHVGGGLVARGGPLRTFEISGADGKFVPAEARIDGDSVVVSSPAVADPVAARYAWSAYPEGCNFYNAAGLPAIPFRTDHPVVVPMDPAGP
jgi:sialate O-acetylesterase